MYARIIDIQTHYDTNSVAVVARNEWGVDVPVEMKLDDRAISAFLRGEAVYVTDRPTHKEW